MDNEFYERIWNDLLHFELV